MIGPATIAVLDVGKTNVKLSACTAEGAVIETLHTPNRHHDGPPWRHPDLPGLCGWLATGLSDLCSRHPLAHVIAAGHGSACVLVTQDPEAGPVLPMVDYEATLPADVALAYAPLAGEFQDRGSAMMLGATHNARQIFWAEVAHPEAFARARHALSLPQYFAWWLSGVAVSEVTALGAQSHLWNVAQRRWTPIVAARDWGRLMPPFAHAGADLGPIRPALMARHRLPALRVHAGLHDSSANHHRFRAAGIEGHTVVSTGTWIVAQAGGVDLSALDEARAACINADLSGAVVGGALCMGGREYAAVAGDQPPNPRARAETLAALVARGSMAVPSFGPDAGPFPGSAGRGRLQGPPPDTADQRHALAVLYTALLTLACADTLGPERPLILDGSYLADPAFAALVAALCPGRAVLTAPESYGIAAGAALAVSGRMPTLALTPAVPMALPGLATYATVWRTLSKGPFA